MMQVIYFLNWLVLAELTQKNVMTESCKKAN
jgi:hypothetical protein